MPGQEFGLVVGEPHFHEDHAPSSEVDRVVAQLGARQPGDERRIGIEQPHVREHHAGEQRSAHLAHLDRAVDGAFDHRTGHAREQRVRPGRAEDLPFADRSFDALVSNFTINHLPRPERAIREFARVLVPGGRVAVSTWDVPARNRFVGILVDAVRASGVTPPAAASAAPDPDRFADDDELRDLLRGARFADVEVRSVSLIHRVADVDELWQGILGGSVRTAGLVMRQPVRTRRSIRAAVERLADEYRADGALAIPARAKIAHGRKP